MEGGIPIETWGAGVDTHGICPGFDPMDGVGTHKPDSLSLYWIYYDQKSSDVLEISNV